MPPERYQDGKAPKVISTDAPAEMILFNGTPALQDVPKTSLQWASNTESDVFFDTAGKQWYVLLSGRWFRAPDLNGAWTFATPDLPADFRNIPEDAPYYAVRASVPGTSEAAEARLKASIPTTARVATGLDHTGGRLCGGRPVRADRVDGSVLRDQHGRHGDQSGRSLFPAPGWRVVRVGHCEWPVATRPRGAGCRLRDPTILTSVQRHLRSCVRDGTGCRLVRLHDGLPVRLPGLGHVCVRHRLVLSALLVQLARLCVPDLLSAADNLGIGAFYNPIRGMYGRYGYAYGPYRGITGARTWNSVTGTYARAGAAWGPRGSAGFIGAYNPRRDAGGYLAGGRNVYGAWGSAGVRRGSEWARVTARDGAAGGWSLRWNTSNGQGFIREGRRGNIYAGRDGNVYRNTGNGWQSFNGGWQDVGRPEPGHLLDRGEGREGLSPEGRDRLQERGGGEALRGIAGAGAAGAAGAALGQRLGAGSEAARRDTAERSAGREQVAQRRSGQSQAQQRGSAQQQPSTSDRTPRQDRTATEQRPAGQQRTDQQHPAAKSQAAATQRPTAKERPAPRPAASQSLPANLTGDVQARGLGNQRQIANREFSSPASQQFSPRSAPTFSAQRSYRPQGNFGGGGGFGGGGSRGGGFGGRGGGRR